MLFGLEQEVEMDKKKWKEEPKARCKTGGKATANSNRNVSLVFGCEQILFVSWKVDTLSLYLEALNLAKEHLWFLLLSLSDQWNVCSFNDFRVKILLSRWLTSRNSRRRFFMLVPMCFTYDELDARSSDVISPADAFAILKFPYEMRVRTESTVQGERFFSNKQGWWKRNEFSTHEKRFIFRFPPCFLITHFITREKSLVE